MSENRADLPSDRFSFLHLPSLLFLEVFVMLRPRSRKIAYYPTIALNPRDCRFMKGNLKLISNKILRFIIQA